MVDRASPAADTELDLRPERTRRRRALIQVAPGPELPHTRDKAGAQAGMAIALALGGVFWAVVGAAALYFLRR